MKKSISKLIYNEYQSIESNLTIECDAATAAKIIDFVAKLKVEINENQNEKENETK